MTKGGHIIGEKGALACEVRGHEKKTPHKIGKRQGDDDSTARRRSSVPDVGRHPLVSLHRPAVIVPGAFEANLIDTGYRLLPHGWCDEVWHGRCCKLLCRHRLRTRCQRIGRKARIARHIGRARGRRLHRCCIHAAGVGARLLRLRVAK